MPARAVTTDTLCAALEAMPDGVLVVGGDERRVLYHNNRFAEMWKIPAEVISTGDDSALLNCVLEQLKSPREFVEKISSLMACSSSSEDVIEFLDGRIFNRRSVAGQDLLTGQYRVWVFTDITRQRQENLDPLTACFNRRAWDELVDDYTTGQQPYRYCIAVIDLDDFKTINDDFGHETGDQVLKRAGEVLQSMCRDEDKPFRLGGDEFTLVVRSAANIEALLLQRLDSALKAAGIHASLGAATAHSGKGIAEAFREADERMLLNKKASKFNRSGLTNIFSAKNRLTKTNHEIALMSDLELALDRHQIHQLYQPIVNAQAELVGAEVLIRWDKGNELIPPEVFIPLAEECQQIHRLWDWSLEESIRQLSRWRSKGLPLPKLALNFSEVQVDYYDHAKHSYAVQIKSLCDQYGVPPSRLRVELPETSLLKDLDVAGRLFKELSSIGITLRIDDYGSGFSSLPMLQKLPVRCLKIDRQFIQALPGSESDLAICKGTILLADALNVKPIAECVETQEQFKALKEIGCNYFQGYYFHRPMGADALAELLVKGIATGHREDDAGV